MTFESHRWANTDTALNGHRGLEHEGEQPYPSLPDPDDEPIIASALAGQAQVFVTRDKALLGLQGVEQLPVISPRQFWEMLAGRDEPG